MKKTIFALALCLTIGIVFGQDSFASYPSSYEGKEYDVSISLKGENKYTLYTEIMSMDRLSDKAGIMLDEKSHPGFLTDLADVKTTYSEWIETAKTNNVTELDKQLSVKTRCGGYFYYGSKWNFQYVVTLNYDFKITDGKYLLIVRTGKLQSSSNQYIDHDGGVIVFTDPSEIDEFISVLSLESVQEFRDKPKEEDLFKE